MRDTPQFATFRALSARLGSDPLRVQEPGGDTSINDGDVMWIKASGTELADAERRDIFVAVSRSAAMAEARGRGAMAVAKPPCWTRASPCAPRSRRPFTQP